MKKIEVGAPSLTGKGAYEEAVATAEGMSFPCSLHVANHMPRAAVFPESGISLASVHANSGTVAEVQFASARLLKRLIRSASEVAELNGYSLALIITDEPQLQVTDEALTEQFVEQHPELKSEVEAAGGIDAAATLAAPAVEADGKTPNDGDAPQSNTTEAPAGEGDTAPADGADNETPSDGDGAGEAAPGGDDKSAPAAAQTEAPKAGGKTKKLK